MRVSFIIPAYNASSTIVRCLNSIYALPIDKSDYEVIVIDDCSTDNTVEIVKQFAVNHSNLLLLQQAENHRQGTARNKGLLCSKGQFIMFVDSDDEISKGVVAAVRMAEELNLDMVAMRYVKVDSEGQVVEEVHLPYDHNATFTGIEMQTVFPFWCTGPTPYIYSKSFLEKVNYPFAEEVLFEDSDFVNVHLYHAKRMAYADDCGYCYHFNATSTTHTTSYKHLADYALLGTRMLAFYESIPEKTTKYAESILEGGSFNIMKSFRRLVRLNSLAEIQAFYDRLDAHYDRSLLLAYRRPNYCWTRWTRLCLKHRKAASLLSVCFMPLFRIIN